MSTGGGTLILYGAGEDGQFVAKYLDSYGLETYIFCDSSKRGILAGREIINNMDDIASLPKYHILITSRKYEKEIYASLLEGGFNRKYISSTRNIFPRGVYFEGDFSSWDEANGVLKNYRAFQGGYSEPHILEKVHKAIMDVRCGKALFERDGVLFYEPQYAYPLLTSLFYVGSHMKKKVTLLDFGGSLGSTYFQNRKLFQNLDFQWNWCIVEQSAFVECGRRDIPEITFYYSIDEFLQEEKAKDCLLLSGVLQYLPNLYKQIDKFLMAGFEYIIVDRTAFYRCDRFCLQYVPESIYEAVYPVHLPDNEKVINKFKNGGYDTVFSWKSEECHNLWENGKIDSKIFLQGAFFKKDNN